MILPKRCFYVLFPKGLSVTKLLLTKITDKKHTGHIVLAWYGSYTKVGLLLLYMFKYQLILFHVCV
ncbi:hypothetical protein D0T49_01500 [Paludibacter sp. 221]|nr:hypothetical protein [Paludibacter sp. 221]